MIPLETQFPRSVNASTIRIIADVIAPLLPIAAR